MNRTANSATFVWHCLVATALLLLSGPVRAQPAMPLQRNRFTLAQVLFLPGEDRRIPVRDPLDWRLCRDTAWAKGTQLGLLQVILALDHTLMLGEPPTCQVRVIRAPAPAGPADLVREAHGCRYVFARRDGLLQSALVTPTPFAPERYETCMLRLGLFLKGYQGVLAIPDADLFFPAARTPWALYPRPPRLVPIFQWTIGACEVEPMRIATRSEVPADPRCHPIGRPRRP